MKLKSSLLIGVVLLLLSSCSAYKQHQVKKWCKVEQSDSTYTIVQYVHDSVLVPYEAITFDTSTAIPFNILIHHEASKGGLKSTLDIKKGVITYKCETDSLNDYIKFQRLQIETVRKSVVKVDVICDKKHHSGWDSFCNYHTVISWVLFIIVIIIFVVKKL